MIDSVVWAPVHQRDRQTHRQPRRHSNCRANALRPAAKTWDPSSHGLYAITWNRRVVVIPEVREFEPAMISFAAVMSDRIATPTFWISQQWRHSRRQRVPLIIIFVGKARGPVLRGQCCPPEIHGHRLRIIRDYSFQNFVKIHEFYEILRNSLKFVKIC